MSDRPSGFWQYNIRELLFLTVVVAVVTTAGLTLGWLNVSLVVFHPLALFVYVAMLFERRIRRRNSDSKLS